MDRDRGGRRGRGTGEGVQRELRERPVWKDGRLKGIIIIIFLVVLAIVFFQRQTEDMIFP